MKDETTDLTEGTHYKVEYTNNVNVGTVTVTITGLWAYDYMKETKTFTIDRRTPSMSYSNTSVTKTYGDSAFINPLTYDGDGTVTYNSSNEGIAKVDATGEVTIVGSGNVTITAIATEGTQYKNAQASYTIEVKKPSTPSVTPTSGTSSPDTTPTPSTTLAPGTTLDPSTTLDPGTTQTPRTTATPGIAPTTTPAPVAVAKVKKISKATATFRNKRVIVTWVKLKGVKGYQIKVGLNNKVTKGAKSYAVKKNTAKKTIKYDKMKKGTKLYIKLRAYIIVNNKKVYGAYCKAKGIKVK